MLHGHPDAEEPRTRSPEALSGAPQALAAPRLATGPRRPSGCPLGPLGITGPLGRRDHRCHRAAGAPPAPGAVRPDAGVPARPPGASRGPTRTGAEQAPGSRGGVEFNPEQSPSSTLPLLGSTGGVRYAAPGEHPGTSPLAQTWWRTSRNRYAGSRKSKASPHPPRRRTGSRTGTPGRLAIPGERGVSFPRGSPAAPGTSSSSLGFVGHRGARRPPRRSSTGHHGGARGLLPAHAADVPDDAREQAGER